jgi:hypothetical protein
MNEDLSVKFEFNSGLLISHFPPTQSGKMGNRWENGKTGWEMGKWENGMEEAGNPSKCKIEVH